MSKIRNFIRVKQLVILCGGKGSRLGKITKKIPKPLIKVNGKPFVEHIIKNFTRFGIDEVLLLCSYKYSQFVKKYDNRFIGKAKVKCFNEGKAKGTAGSILAAKKYLHSFFYLCNGDTFFDFNPLQLCTSLKKGTQISFALKKIKNVRYGSISLVNGKVKNFTNICSLNKPSIINGGFYLLKKSILNFIGKKNFSLEQEVFPKLAKRGLISGKLFTGNFLDIGVVNDLKRSDSFLKKTLLKPALFLDRDGIVNKDFGYVYKYEQIIWIKNIKKIIKIANNNNYYVFIITNQSGIGRGFYKHKDVNDLHSRINEELFKNLSHIDDFFYAPYYRESKLYKFTKKDFLMRKPNIGMIKNCKKEWPFDLSKSILIGDKVTDMLAATKAGIKKKILFKRKMNLLKEFKKIAQL